MEKINYTEFIERYINDEMKEDEKFWFEKELESDPGLASDLDLHKNIQAAVLEEGVMNLRGQLDKIHREMVLEKTKSGSSIFKIKKLAYYSFSAVVLFIVSGLLIFNLNSPVEYSADELYNTYYQPYKSIVSYRTTGTDADYMFQQAMVKYENQEFAEALIMFEAVLSNQPEEHSNHAANLYAGISYMENNKFGQAKGAFRQIIDDNNNLFVEQAEWYLAFCHLMSGEGQEAKELFAQISGSNSYYHTTAKEIAEKME